MGAVYSHAFSERIKLSSASLMPNLFKDTCASKRYFHFVRFSLEMCEESMVNDLNYLMYRPYKFKIF